MASIELSTTKFTANNCLVVRKMIEFKKHNGQLRFDETVACDLKLMGFPGYQDYNTGKRHCYTGAPVNDSLQLLKEMISKEVDITQYHTFGTNIEVHVDYLKHNNDMTFFDENFFVETADGFIISKYMLMIFKQYISEHKLGAYFKIHNNGTIIMKKEIINEKIDGMWVKYENNNKMGAHFGYNIKYINGELRFSVVKPEIKELKTNTETVNIRKAQS